VKKQLFPARRVLCGVVLATIGLACSDATGPKTAPVASIDITGVPATLYVGATATLSATPRDADGEALANRAVSWVSSDTSIAAVSAAGAVTARRVGTAVIVATSEQQSATASLKITLEPPAAVEITGAPAGPVVAGAVVQLGAVAKNAAGAPIAGRVMTWSTSSAELATVSDSGKVTTRKAGDVVITAANEGVSTTFTLRIADPVVAVEIVGGPAAPVLAGTSVQLSVVARNAAGAAMSGRAVTWTSGNPEIATVSSGGTVATLRGGEVSLTATVEGVSATFTLTVLERVTTLEITGAPEAPVLAGTVVQLVATARSADGAPLPGRAITWASQNTLASVSAAGLVQTLGAGEVVITATHQGVTASVTIQVLEPVATVQITGAPTAPVLRGAEVQLGVIARGLSGAALSGRAIAWNSSNPSIATVSSGGTVQLVGTGMVSIIATVEGVNATVTLNVLEPIATVQITGGPTGPVVAGTSFQLSAVARSAAGGVLTGRAVVWTSKNALATVSPTGMVQTVGAGDVEITATVEGVSATLPVQVLVPVATVQIIRARDTLIVGGTMQMRAVARSAAGDSLGGRTVTWTSSSSSHASVSADGLVTAKFVGNVLITASVEGRSASFILRVLPPVASVTVTAPFAGMYPGQTLQLAATARDEGGSELPDRPITWSTSDPSRATVDSAGVVTGVGQGEVTIAATSENVKGAITLQVLAPSTGEWGQATTWSTHQGNSRHTGFVPATADVRVFDRLWARSPLGATSLNPVTEGDGRVFISGYAYFGGQMLAAVDANTGTGGWSHAFGTIHGVHPPAFGNGRAYVTTSGHGDSYLYAFDAASGSLAFREPYGNQWSRYLAPVVSGEAVYMAGGYYGGMYSFNSTTGAQRWFANTNQYDEFTPAVADGRVYVHTGSYTPKLQVHDAATGAEVFSIPDPSFSWDGWSMRGSPVLGSMNNVLVTQGGRLVSFDLAARAVGWQKTGGFTGNVTLANGVLYVMRNGQVEARSESDGALLWLWVPPSGQQVSKTMVATRNLLFVSTQTHTYAIDLAARMAVWSYDGGGHLALGRDGILFIAQEDGMLHAVKLK
jgi:uncharacterized protein YjdB